MDLVDIISEKRFVGQEFLTWLWFKSEERGGAVQLDGEGDIQVVFEKHMLLESGEGEAHEKLICKGLQAELQEARTGLRMGKKIEQARIFLAKGEYEYHFTRNVRLPKTLTPGEESSDRLALEGKILEKIGMVEEAMRTIDGLFRMFLKIRVGDDWPVELAKMRAWVLKGAEK